MILDNWFWVMVLNWSYDCSDIIDTGLFSDGIILKGRV